MRWFINLSIRSKLFLAFGLMIVLLGLVALEAYRGIDTIQEDLRSLYEDDFAIVRETMGVRFNQTKIRANSATALLVPDPATRAALLKDGDDRVERIDEWMGSLLAREQTDPKRLAKLQELDTLTRSFAEIRGKQVVPLILAGKLDEATALVVEEEFDLNQKINAIADELVAQAEADAQSSFTASTAIAAQAIRLFVAIAAIALVLAILIAVLLSRVISTPLAEISRGAGRIASGDLTVEVSADSRKDEVGALTGAFRAMVANLRGLNAEVKVGVNVLASSANEILATTAQLGAGATETAAAVSQTTVTVEEVRQTAQLSGQKAKLVSESAQRAAQVSQDGRKAVEETVEGMNRVRDQVESIAGNIVRLSEQSQAIAEIAGTVADLAGQVNLLSVNAGIEASKAGEQGKGFLVVAQEIKALAGQAKQATVQVRSILNEVQKNISAAVMATEQGSKIAEAGAAQAGRAGEAIQSLANTAAESAQAAIQVAASSRQQQAGMDQLAAAMQNITQASAQNAAGAKQAEDAARSLHDLGQSLRRLVERYKVEA